MALAVVLLLLALTRTQQIRDWYMLQGYTPPPEVSSLARVDTMTAYARMLFYVNKPNLENKYQFASNCPSGTAQTYVIGCYHSGDNGIYLLNVKNSSLNGIVDVTAAYEMLHAGYARLSGTESSKIDAEMWQFYTRNVKSKIISAQMAAYAKTEPGARYDELYSVLATEVKVLPSSLNAQYRRYFLNRDKIVAMYDNYQAAFTSRQQKIESYDRQMTSLKQQIKAEEAKISSLFATSSIEQKQLNSYQANGNYSSYNNSLGQFNALVSQYNSLVSEVRGRINSYNLLAKRRNSLVLEEQDMVSSISAAPSRQL